MSKKVAEIQLDDLEFVNDSLMDFYDSPQPDSLDGEEEVEEQEDIVEDDYPTNTLEDSTDEEDTTEDVDEEDGDELEGPREESLDDYNNLALLALSLKEEDPDLLDFEIEKDLKPETLISSLKSQIAKSREAVVKDVEEKYGEAATYLNMILEGAPENTVKESLSYNRIASIQLTGDEPEEGLEQVVKAWLYRRGTPESDIEDLISLYKDKGVLQERAEESIEFHKEQQEVLFNNWQTQRDTQIATEQKRQAEYQKAIKTQIDRGIVKGLVIKDKKKFEEAIFKPTETIEYIDESGKKRLTKVPLLQVKMNNMNNDLEQQLALQFLVLQDFDFTSLMDSAKRKVSNNLINVLNDRVSSGKPRSSSSKYFED